MIEIFKNIINLLGDIKGRKTLNDKLKKTCYNYKPDLIVTGHADLISKEQIQELKEDNPNTLNLHNGF